MDFYLNRFILTGKNSGGLSLKAIFINMLNECGIPHDCPCPKDCEVIDNHVTGKKIYTQAQVDMSIEALIAYVQTLEDRIVALGG